MSLDGFRNFAQGKGAKIILGLITLPFAFWGVDSYFKNGNDQDFVAKVNGEPISQNELNDAIKSQQQYLRQTLGEASNLVLENPSFKADVLNKLIERKLLIEESKSLNFSISDAQIAQIISGIPAFQEKGVFDHTKYENIVKQQGIEVKDFEKMLRQDLMLNAMQVAISDASFASKKVIENLIKINEQKRELSIFPIDVNKFINSVKVEDKAIDEFYKKNLKNFETPLQVKLDYVVFSADEFASKQVASDAEIADYYSKNPDKFKTLEERKASHILLPKAKKAEAEKLLAELKAKPADFAESAKKNSIDPGSAGQGGDLGFFGKGMMTKNFEDAVFTMKPNEMRLVETEFGWHIIMLTEIHEGKTPQLAEIKDNIASELKRQKGLAEFNKVAESFTKTASEQSNSLQPVADSLKLKVEHTDFFAKDHAPAGSLATHPKILAKAFNADFLKSGKNSEAIEISPNTLVVIRINEQKASRQLPLIEVKENILKQLKAEQAINLAKDQAKQLLQKLQSGQNTDEIKWSQKQSMQRTEALRNGLNEDGVQQVFNAKFDKNPIYFQATIKNGVPILVRLTNVIDLAEVDENKRKTYKQQVNQVVAGESWNNYLKNLKQRYDIKIKDQIKK